MKAAVIHEYGAPLQIEEIPAPVPGEGEVLVRVEAAGLCHTDIHSCRGDWPVKPKLPLFEDEAQTAEHHGMVVGKDDAHVTRRPTRCGRLL